MKRKVKPNLPPPKPPPKKKRVRDILSQAVSDLGTAIGGWFGNR